MDNRCWCGLEIPEDGDCQHGTDIKIYLLYLTDREKIAALTAELEREKKLRTADIKLAVDHATTEMRAERDRLRKGIAELASRLDEDGFGNKYWGDKLRALLEKSDKEQ